jgi:transposase-like protein
MDLLLTEPRDTEAAGRFLQRARRRHGVPEPLPMDGRDAHEAAIKSEPEAHGPPMICNMGLTSSRKTIAA